MLENLVILNGTHGKVQLKGDDDLDNHKIKQQFKVGLFVCLELN
jgi:hypothetical protein